MFQMWVHLMTAGLLVLTMEASTSLNCSNPLIEVTACGRFSANGCCAKGCVRNARDRCVPEQCTQSWSPWLSRPMSMSCYFHWFLVIFAALITLVMTILVMCNVGYEVRRYLRQRRQRNFRPIRNLSGSSLGSTQC